MDKNDIALRDFAAAFGYDTEDLAAAISSAARGEFGAIDKFAISYAFTGNQIRLSFRGQTEIVERNADAVTNVLVKWGQMNGIRNDQ